MDRDTLNRLQSVLDRSTNGAAYLVENAVWRLDWVECDCPDIVGCQSDVLVSFLDMFGEFVIHAEEDMAELSVEFGQSCKISKNKRSCLVCAKTSRPNMKIIIDYLETQSWIAMGGPYSWGVDLLWDINKFFDNPSSLAEFTQQNSASFSIVPFFDNIEWLLAISV